MALLALAGCGGDALERYVAKREALFDGMAVATIGACAERAAELGADPCADGTIDLDKFGAALPPDLAGIRDDYCGLLEAGGTAAAVARATVVIRVNAALRTRHAPVFKAGVCPAGDA